MANYCGVYKISNTVSGKFYIGSSICIRQRFLQHRSALNRGSHQNSHLQSSWNKYGKQVFEFEVLLVCSPEKMRFYEQILIDNLHPKYNKSLSATSGVAAGSKCSEEHKKKVGASSKNLWSQEDFRKKVTSAIQSAMTEDECKKRASRTALLWTDAEYRKKSIDSRKGKAYNKGYKCTPEQVLNRQRAARISNMKRNYGADWTIEYARRYPEYAGDMHGK
jgi:group I intron endonuclease